MDERHSYIDGEIVSTNHRCEWCGVAIWINNDGSPGNSYIHGDDCPTNSRDLLTRKMLNKIYVMRRKITELERRLMDEWEAS